MQAYNQYRIKWRETQAIPLKSATRQGCPLSFYMFNIALEVSARAIKLLKKIKGI